MADSGTATVDLDAKLAELLALSPADRIRLAERLIESVPMFASEEDQHAWSAEIARRIEEFESGKVQAIPWEQVRAELRTRLESMRNASAKS